MTDTELIERLAALEHEQWAHWTQHMLDVLSVNIPLGDEAAMALHRQTGNFLRIHGEAAAVGQYERQVESFEAVKRWRRQSETPYADLSEAEKESDRDWAHRVLDILREVD